MRRGGEEERIVKVKVKVKVKIMVYSLAKSQKPTANSKKLTAKRPKK